MVFNDNFLEEEYANLPAYQGTEVLEVRRVQKAVCENIRRPVL